MEIEGGILLPEVQFKKLCKIYSLRVLKIQKNNPIKKAYINSIKDKEGRDKLVLDSSLESANSRIRQVLPQTNLTTNIRRAYPFIRNWAIEKVSSKWDKLWQREIQA